MHIVIIGAGIAGMSCAIALTQAGHTVTVYERHPDPHAGASPRAMQRLEQSGALLQHLDIGRLDRHMGYASHAFFRRDLVGILADWLARHGVAIHYGAAGLALASGADGRKQSVARQYVLGENRPRFQGFVNWVGAIEVDQNLAGQPGVQDLYQRFERDAHSAQVDPAQLVAGMARGWGSGLPMGGPATPA